MNFMMQRGAVLGRGFASEGLYLRLDGVDDMKNKVANFGLLWFVLLLAQPSWADPAQFLGKSLDQWFKSYFEWYLNGSKPIKYQVDGVRFLPLPEPVPIPVDPNNPSPGVTFTGGTLDISVKENQHLLIPLSTWTGEYYADGNKDDPSILVANDVFNGTTIKVVLDGKSLYSGTAQQFNSFHFGPFNFDQPIPYAQPTTYGAKGAVWEEGTGFILPPLPNGKHQLKIETVTPVFGLGFDNTWNIRVRGHGEKKKHH